VHLKETDMGSQLDELKKGLKNMENSPKDKKKAIEVEPCPQPDFPYGLRIELNKDSLKKLGLKVSDFEIASEVCLVAKAEVCGISSNKRSNYESESVSLQICELSIKDEDE